MLSVIFIALIFGIDGCFTSVLQFVSYKDCSKWDETSPFTLKIEVNGDIPKGHVIVVEHQHSSTIWDYDVPPPASTSKEQYVLCNGVFLPLAYLVPISSISSKIDPQICSSLGANPDLLYSQSNYTVYNAFQEIQDSYHRISAFLVQISDPNFPRIAITSEEVALHLTSEFVSRSLYIPNPQRHWPFIAAKNNAALEKRRSREELTRATEEAYVPLHPEIFTLSEAVFAPEFVEAFKNGSLLSILKKETDSGIYSFPLLNLEFCRKLIEEVANFESSGIKYEVPNSMNNYGAVLDHFGFHGFLDQLMSVYLKPITSALFRDWGGATLDDHHGFVVEYQVGKDEDLSYHMDACEVTLNVCLGKEFTGGDLVFEGVRGEPSEKVEKFEFSHVPGHAIIHVGQHWHAAKKIQTGERYNLILWMMSSDYRSSALEHYMQRCGHLPGPNIPVQTDNDEL